MFLNGSFYFLKFNFVYVKKNVLYIVFLKYLAACCIMVLLYSACSGGSGNSSKVVNEMDTISFATLSEVGRGYLQAQQDTMQSVHKLNSYTRWEYDQTQGQLIFYRGNKKMVIDYEMVGTYSLKDSTWLWAWGNPSVSKNVLTELEKIRSYGEERGFGKLSNRKWKTIEQEGWEMTWVCAYLMKAKGAFKVPSDNDSLFSFMLYKNIHSPQ